MLSAIIGTIELSSPITYIVLILYDWTYLTRR